MQSSLSIKPDRRRAMTRDYKRHGAAALFAALNLLLGKVIGQYRGCHRHQECLKFPRCLDRAFPRELTRRVMPDNYATRNHEAVRHWTAAHPRFKLRCTPTGASWLHLVEIWFSKLKQQHNAFAAAAIEDYSTHRNVDPKPSVRSATVDAILDKASKRKVILGTYR